MISRFQKYLKRKKLTLNAEKSKVMIFKKRRGKKKREEWRWNEERLEEIKEFKYLGFYFQKSRGYETHINEIIKKAVIATA